MAIATITKSTKLGSPFHCMKNTRLPAGGNKKAEAHICTSAFLKELAATYSRGTYRTTTIGKTVFDGRVRKGIGSGHSFITTKIKETGERSQETVVSLLKSTIKI
jgi:hypothetical protein